MRTVNSPAGRVDPEAERRHEIGQLSGELAAYKVELEVATRRREAADHAPDTPWVEPDRSGFAPQGAVGVLSAETLRVHAIGVADEQIKTIRAEIKRITTAIHKLEQA